MTVLPFSNLTPDMVSPLSFETLSTQWLSKMSRYLSGHGHPRHPLLNLLPTDELDRPEVYRAERLLKLATGAVLLPTESDWMITVRFL